jgi:DNA-binding winged helix-turn-helix (wHTH) protein
MQRADQPESVVRFGAFEMDFGAEELRKNGRGLKLRGQPFQILSMLLERPGALVTREELRQRLWPQGTFVDFDHSLNAAVNRIREVLGDSAENPRFIETLARRGYRFVAPLDEATRDNLTDKGPQAVETLTTPEVQAALDERLEARERPTKQDRPAKRWIGLSAGLALVVVAGWFFGDRLVRRSFDLPHMKVTRLTSFPGKEERPALSPDGRMVAFVWGR